MHHSTNSDDSESPYNFTLTSELITSEQGNTIRGKASTFHICKWDLKKMA